MGPRILNTDLRTDSAPGAIREQAGLAIPCIYWRSWIPYHAGQDGPGNRDLHDSA